MCCAYVRAPMLKTSAYMDRYTHRYDKSSVRYALAGSKRRDLPKNGNGGCAWREARSSPAASGDLQTYCQLVGRRDIGEQTHITLNERANTTPTVADDLDSFDLRIGREVVAEPPAELSVVHIGRQAATRDVSDRNSWRKQRERRGPANENTGIVGSGIWVVGLFGRTTF